MDGGTGILHRKPIAIVTLKKFIVRRVRPLFFKGGADPPGTDHARLNIAGNRVKQLMIGFITQLGAGPSHHAGSGGIDKGGSSLLVEAEYTVASSVEKQFILATETENHFFVGVQSTIQLKKPKGEHDEKRQNTQN